VRKYSKGRITFWFSDNFRALKQMLSRKDLLPMVVFLSMKAFPAEIIREGAFSGWFRIENAERSGKACIYRYNIVK
jgi:hypothetical protein